MSGDNSQEVRVAVLEQQMRDLQRRYNEDMIEVKNDVKAILSKFNQMTGGQKAWFGLASMLGLIIGAIAGIVTTFVTLTHLTPPR